MSDLETVLWAYRRILHVCGQRSVRVGEAGAKLSAHRLGILSYLDVEDPVMVTELAEHLGVTASTMSLTLKRLDEAGFVRRQRDPADRRVVNVRLTEAGVSAVGDRSVLAPDRVDALLRLLDAGRRREAVRGISLLAQAADRLSRRGEAALRGLTGR